MIIEADTPDRFSEQMRQAYSIVGRAWSIVRNSIGLYSESEVKRARDFLRTLGMTCRSEGKSRGDKTRASENQRMLYLFFLLSKSEKTLKEVAFEMEPTKDPERLARSLSVQMKRFSRKVHAEVCARYGHDQSRQVPAGFLLHERAWGHLSSLFGSIARWPGVKSNCPEHGYALCEALRRHTPAKTDAARERSGSISQAIQYKSSQ
jgi:hypothetical protein